MIGEVPTACAPAATSSVHEMVDYPIEWFIRGAHMLSLLDLAGVRRIRFRFLCRRCVAHENSFGFRTAPPLPVGPNDFNVNVNIYPEEMFMNELVSRIADNVGLAPDVAEKAMGMMLGFLQREADDGAVAKMIEAIPGAPELVAQFNGEGAGGGGLLGGLMASFGGGVMALGQQLMAQGLGMGEITALARETMAVAREHAGDEVVDQVIASVPGLSQFV